MKIYTSATDTNRPTVEDLAKRVADCFNEDIEDGFDGWEDYVIRSRLSSSDIKEEIVDLLNYFWNEDHKQHKAYYSVSDTGTVYIGDDEYSYRKFKGIVMKYVIHDADDQDIEDDME